MTRSDEQDKVRLPVMMRQADRDLLLDLQERTGAESMTAVVLRALHIYSDLLAQKDHSKARGGDIYTAIINPYTGEVIDKSRFVF